MKKISIVTPCYDEQDNVRPLHDEVKKIFKAFPQYQYEHIFIDNASTDRTVEVLRQMAQEDSRVKVIVNSRNFGHIRSPFHAVQQAQGDAVISMAADFQEPPSLIPELISKWEAGSPIVMAIKSGAAETSVFYILRRFYYFLVSRISDVELMRDFTGFGLYDRKVVDILRTVKDTYPYFRGLICEIGFEKAKVEYRQPLRTRGITKNNFYTLYDLAVLGFVNHSKVPLRLAIFTGTFIAFASLLVAFGYFVYKLLYWDSFLLGTAPLVIGLFFFSAVQLLFIGILGEYIGAILSHVKGRPLVIEKERINF